MRTRAALLLAAFAILVLVTSAIVTSHFGMRDWPTPPLPDTATRLISPTEAVGRLSDRATGDDDGSARPTADAGTAPAGRFEHRAGVPQRRSRATADRGGSSRRGHSGTRRGTRHGAGGGTPTGGSTPAPGPSSGDAAGTPATTTPAEPTTTAPAPTAPLVEAGAGDPTQARPQGPDPQVPVPPVPSVPSVPGGTGDGSGDGHGGGASSGHGHRHGPIHTLLDALL
jgi:hypothetical protein